MRGLNQADQNNAYCVVSRVSSELLNLLVKKARGESAGTVTFSPPCVIMETNGGEAHEQHR